MRFTVCLRCKQKNDFNPYQEKPTVYKDSLINFMVSEKKIRTYHKNDSIVHFYKSGVINKIGNYNYLTIINPHNNQVEIYNVDTQQPILSLNPSKFSGKKNETIHRAYTHNFDSIFVTMGNSLYIIDSMENVIRRVEIEKHINLANVEKEFPIFFDEKNNTIYLHHLNKRLKRFSKEFYTSNIEVSINLDTNEKNLLPIKGTNLYLEGFYGLCDQAKRLHVGNHHYYTFDYDPNIYVLDIYENNYTVFGGKSALQDTIRPLAVEAKLKLDKTLMMNYANTTPLYTRLLYDSSNDLFFRFLYKAKEKVNKYNALISLTDQELVLIVYNKNMDVIHEEELPASTYFPIISFVTEEGLHVRTRYSTPNFITYKVFNLKSMDFSNKISDDLTNGI